MNRNTSHLSRRRLCLRSVALTSMGCFASATVAVGAEAVLVTGMTHDFGEQLAYQDNSPFTIDDVCSTSASSLGPQLKLLVDHMDSAAVEAGSPITLGRIENLPGAPNRYEIERDLAEARTSFCDNRESGGFIEPFAILYTSCRMTMVSPGSTMAINIPTGSNTARMLAADHATSEVAYVDLNVELNAVATSVGSGWAQSIQMTPENQSGRHIGYPTELYSFTFNSGLGNSGSGGTTQVTGAPSFGGMVEVKSDGTAWVARNAPGRDVISAFYENLTSSVEMGGQSMFSGMIMNMVSMLRDGIPLLTEQSMTSTVMGRTMSAGRMRSVVTGIRVRDLDWTDCEPLPIPENYTATDLNEQLSQAAGNMPSAEEMNAAMAEYQQMMENLSPEERAMLEQMGMGDRMGQIMGGAPGGGMPGSAATTPLPAGASATGSAMAGTASADLMGSSVEESVGNHLQALGYDTGSGGSSDLFTAIAISQFQAERGMEVTGEASPQLLGLLAAEVEEGR